jgi:phosphoenolpyruvate carboxylase
MLIRAFSIYFDLINLAEQRVRLRVLRWQANDLSQPALDGVEAAFLQLREKGVTSQQLADLFRRGLIVPVFTAHPSEARRRTILEKLDSLAHLMDRSESEQLFPREREAALAGIREEVETFWLTSLVRSDRPTVLDEVRQGGRMLESLFEVVRGELSAFRFLDRRRPRRSPARDSHRHRRCDSRATGNHSAALSRPRRKAGAAFEHFG